MHAYSIRTSCYLFLIAASLLAPPAISQELYFPPADGKWETVDPAQSTWNMNKLEQALDYLGQQRSTGVVILHRGKILAERYWEPTGDNSSKFDQRLVGRDRSGHAIEDVASVQKSIAALLVGLAQQQGLLNIDQPVSQYLGKGWSKAASEQEQVITIRHLLTMTSGLDLRGRFEAEAGTKWRYNTPVYAKTMDVLAAASDLDRHALSQAWLTLPLGMSNSSWVSRGAAGQRAGNSYGFATTARDLARFGLLMLARGNWNGEVVLPDTDYLDAATKSSQKHNPHYGYLWWVSQNAWAPAEPPAPPSAPADMFAAKGALGRRCFVVPSMSLVVTRLGDQPLAPKSFDNQVWKLLMDAKN